MSPRERLLAGACVLFALVFIPLKTYDWSQAQRAALVSDKADLQALKAQTRRQAARQVRGGHGPPAQDPGAQDPGAQDPGAEDLGTQQRRIRSWAWPSPSFAVARVMLESQLAQTAIQANLVNPDVQSDPQPDVAGGVDFVRLDVSAPFAWDALRGFLQGLARLGKGFVVAQVQVQDDGTGSRLRLVVLVPVTLVPISTYPASTYPASRADRP